MLLQKLSPSRLEAYASPLVVVGAAAILAVVVVVLAVYNVNRETRFVSTLLSEKGAVLVRTFEAGTRAGMMGMFGPQQRLQVLAEQFAMLPGINAITLTDMQGVIRSSSQPEREGQLFLKPEAFQELEPGDELKWKVLETPQGERSFLVYKIFTPLRFGSRQSMHHGRRSGPMAERMRRNWEHFCQMMGDGEQPPESGGTQSPPSLPKAVLFVAMDVTPFEQARAQDVRTTVLLAATLLALGLGGVVALYWAQRLRASRRMLLDTRAFAGEVITHMPMGLVAMDPEGRVSMANPAAETMLAGACRLEAGQGYAACLPRELADVLDRVRQGEDVHELEVQLAGEEDTPLPLAVSGARIEAEGGRSVGAILLLRDLREIRRLEAAVRRAEKLAAIGSLAAGVAHEIRNPLSSIKAAATFFGQQFEQDSDGKRMAGIMIQEVERLNRVVGQLLDYARPSQLQARDVELLPLVQRSLELVGADAAAKEVSLSLQADYAPQRAELDPDRLNQALLNLYVNAIQAMEHGGAVTVRMETARLGHKDAVRITVSDTGPGLPPGDPKRVFDPYVTTKARGAGLGLAIVQKIAEAHHGEVDVHSEPGKGASFSLTLPLAPDTTKGSDTEESEDSDA